MRLLHHKGEGLRDTQTGMLHGIPRSARCVQRFDDSLNSAIHITYRISLRSSSMREPRDPLLKVVTFFMVLLTFETELLHLKAAATEAATEKVHRCGVLLQRAAR